MAKILIVDDSPNNRSLLVQFLGSFGHSLREAADGAEALALVSSERPDLVITDILMPTMDGYEFVRRLRSAADIAQTPVIFWTAHFRERDARDLAGECGVEYILSKPCDLETVRHTVEACLNRTAPEQVPPVTDSFDRDHLRLLMDKLIKQTGELTVVNSRLEALVETALRLASETEPGRLLEEFCKSARYLMSAKYALVGIPSADGQYPDFLSVAGVSSERYPSLNNVQIAHSAVAGLLKSQPTGRFRNTGGDPAALGFPAEYPSFASVLVAPIVSPSHSYGWLCLFHRLGSFEFSEEDERLAGILGALAGRIYESGKLYTAAQRHGVEMEKEVAVRTRAEEALRTSEARYRLFFEDNPLPGWLWDLKTRRFLDVNHAAIRHYGFSRDEFLSKTILEIRPPEEVPELLERTSTLVPGVEHQGRWKHLRKDGTIIDVDVVSHVVPGSQPAVFTLVHDVTEQRKLEEKLRQSQKMEAIGQLAGGIAHDFNNVLNVIIGYSKLLLANSTPRDPAYRRIEEIHNAGERAAALTHQLLAFSRKQVLQPRLLNLGDTLNDMDHMVRRIIGEDIEVITKVDEDLDQVKIDPNQLHQVILNLVVNARDAMPEGGTLTLELMNTELDPSSGRIHNIAPGKYVMLAVSDNGCGMTPEVRQRVFEPFFTTKEAGQGTGLGLATVYGIVEQSGGHIWLYSEPGIGTTFKIFFPRVDQRQESVSRELPQPIARGEETILVVEDDSAVRSLVHEILTSAGYNVIAAENGNAAIRASEEHEGHIHLLLSDVVLPKMGGREVASRITALRPGIKVLFMSGYTGNAIAQHGTLNPAVAFLQKPFTPEALCAKIRAVLTPRSSIQRILVVDDDASLRNLLRETLEGAGFQAFTAEDGRSARAQVANHPVDLVITDLAMPGEEGLEMIRILKKEHPKLKIVAMSGAFGSSVLKAAQLLGAHASLTKPLSRETILQCIDDLSEVRPR